MNLNEGIFLVKVKEVLEDDSFLGYSACVVGSLPECLLIKKTFTKYTVVSRIPCATK
jgi:hypothetical protein